MIKMRNNFFSYISLSILEKFYIKIYYINRIKRDNGEKERERERKEIKDKKLISANLI